MKSVVSQMSIQSTTISFIQQHRSSFLPGTAHKTTLCCHRLAGHEDTRPTHTSPTAAVHMPSLRCSVQYRLGIACIQIDLSHFDTNLPRKKYKNLDFLNCRWNLDHSQDKQNCHSMKMFPIYIGYTRLHPMFRNSNLAGKIHTSQCHRFCMFRWCMDHGHK